MKLITCYGRRFPVKFRIAICEDDPAAAQKFQEMVLAWAELSRFSCQADCFPSSESFLFQCGGQSLYDILLLDVEMPGESGIDLAKRIRGRDKRTEIIFTTSHFEFIGEGYEVDALHYLVKPVTEKMLFPVLTKAAEKLSAAPKAVLIQSAGETVKLTEDEITYVEAFAHYISVHTSNGSHTVKESISAFEDRLSDRFFRIHRSYIVSLSAIRRISRKDVTLSDGAVLPLARGLYDKLNRAFIAHN